MNRNPTQAERALQIALAGLPFEDRIVFVAQKVIRGFIVDLLIPDARLIVEVDGPYHQFRKRYDAKRDRILKAAGYRIVRFTNDDVLSDAQRCVRAIMWKTRFPEMDRDWFEP